MDTSAKKQTPRIKTERTPSSSNIPLQTTNKKQGKSMKKINGQQHRFLKKTFQRPTWCPFAQKFIWGLDKSGYECRACKLTVSRRFISQAKQSSCGELQMLDVGNTVSAEACRTRVFTVYLPYGAKKSVLLNPMEPLHSVLQQICLARGMNMDDYVAEDTNGQIVELNTILGKIPGSQITFTEKDNLGPPPPKSEPSPPNLATSFQKPTNSSGSNPIHTKEDNRKSKSNSSSIKDLYIFGAELGAGAFSIVKAAKHRDTGKEVAIKILDKYEDDDEQTQKFKSEIEIISQLKHSNIVEFYELDEDEDNFYVVMELVGGGELFDYIVQKKAIPEMEAVSVIAQVLKAIQYMHSVGIAHRDLKPENLLFKEKDFKVIKIADFGESKKFSGKNLNTYCGTPDYMAPEIIKGDPYGPEVDIWSIGAITYVMLGGFPPFDGENDVEVFASILAVKYSFPAPEWTNISDDAKDFIASIFVGADDRLTAEGCLNHRWIRNNVPAELLVNTTTPPVQAGKPAIDMHKSNPEIKKEETTPENSVVETKEEGALERVPSLVISGEEEKNSIEDSQKKKKKKYAASLEEDLREPKVRLLEGINELLKSSLTAENPLLGGELKAMLIVVTAASGEITNDFENLIFKTYLDRLKELNGLTRKSSGKVPMSARAPGSAHKKKKDKK